MSPAARPSFELEGVTKLLGLFAILAYLAGVITVATYTETLDVSSPSLDLFKTRYILTGVAVLASFLVPVAFFYSAFHFIREESGKDEHRYGRVGFLFLAAFLIYVAIVHFVVRWGSGDDLLFPAVNWRFFVLPWIAGIAGIAAYLAWHYSDLLNKGESNGVNVHTIRAFVVMVGCGIGVVFSIVFAHWVYPFLPEQFGGGKSKHALLTFTAEGAGAAASMGLQLQEGTRNSLPVEILYQDDSQFTVRVQSPDQRSASQRTIQVDKSLIAGFSSDSRPPHAQQLLVKTGQDYMIPAMARDAIAFEYNETIPPGSLIPDWTGQRRPVRVELSRSGDEGYDYALKIWDPRSEERIPLGRVEVDADNLRPNSVRASLRQVGQSYVLRMKGPLISVRRSRPEVTQATWVPNEHATDSHGNACEAEVEPESRTLDVDEFRNEVA